MPPHRFHIVDVFAEALYAGNTLAVVRDAADLDIAAMQRIAREFGFSETTFIASDPRDGLGMLAIRVRIFTPTEELPFAGHPTLGTAWVIREHLTNQKPAALSLALGVGRVPVRFEPAPDGGELVWLTAPAVTLGERVGAEQIARALGLTQQDFDARLPVQCVSAGPDFAILPLRSIAAMQHPRVDLEAFNACWQDTPPHAVYLFAQQAQDPANDFHARMLVIGEAAGQREDPATGSATACLGAYLLAHGQHGTELSLRIEQGVEMGRPSLLRLEASGGDGAMRIRVGGRVIESARGELL